MMRRFILQRVSLPIAMLTLLLLSLAYWWLENVAHELFGTAMFGLLSWHVYLNRLWFRNLARGTYNARRLVGVLLHVGLIVNMVLLLVTSLMISETVFAWGAGRSGGKYLREVHWLSAYWVIMTTGVHVGLHWERLWASLASRLGLAGSKIVTAALYLLTLLAVWQGLASFRVLGVWTKLTFNRSLEFWDFTSSVAPFFGHWLMAFTLSAVLTHFLMKCWRALRGARQLRIATGEV